MYRPLADEIRPVSLDEVVGQRHLLGEDGVLRRIIDSGRIPNMVFFGPSGTGKTTVAGIIAGRTRRALHRLNATTASIADIRNIIGDVDTLLAPEGVLLYLDEIQYFNKKQQQSLLEFIENGKITLIASTTENPYFYVYGALLSRSTVFEFKPVPPEEISRAVRRAFTVISGKEELPLVWDEGIVDAVARSCGGDVRKAVNAAELLAASAAMKDGKRHVRPEDVSAVSQRSSMRYDRDGDSHYDVISAFQKSIRGSDPDAAVHYLARLLEAGDLPSVCRRLLVVASEDIGLAHPQAISVVKACVDSALQLGLPEARIPLSEAVLLLATAPKSNSAITAVDAALADIRAGRGGEVPPHLMDSHYPGAEKLGRGRTYQYPHSYPGHYTSQQYLPDSLKNARYYEYGDNKAESAARRYWEELKGKE
ncbi:replication-associated recombination protein A [Papillibacter cinnamivorans]|uniref:Putative ATPase n=1 Tax=Papillibacter cinnamivorans DSM 12816 TaxID=1122930 RepID=A0A1W1YL55_9FIRM|nr:replication-associated recombination protein A [Papillibacter cinnamivorans]SMC36907.1 putative ATPase [Papillibacter cinnamivorans DSM 12816]